MKTRDNYVYINGTYTENLKTTKNELNELHGQFFIGGGPIFSYGYEQKINDFSYEFLFYQGFIIGGESFNGEAPTGQVVKYDAINDVNYNAGGFNFQFIMGVKLRLNYNYFKKLK